MWAVILLLCVLIFSVIALLIAYFDLRDTVKIMQSTIDFQNERYEKCLKELDEIAHIDWLKNIGPKFKYY